MDAVALRGFLLLVCCCLPQANAVLVAHPGATIIGSDVDCGQQRSKYSSPACKVCRHGVDVIEAACRRMPACVAFVYDDASGCGDLKSVSQPRVYPCNGRGGPHSCRTLSLQANIRGGLTTFVLLDLKGGRQQQQTLPDSTAAASVVPAEPVATAAELQLDVIAATFGK